MWKWRIIKEKTPVLVFKIELRVGCGCTRVAVTGQSQISICLNTSYFAYVNEIYCFWLYRRPPKWPPCPFPAHTNLKISQMNSTPFGNAIDRREKMALALVGRFRLDWDGAVQNPLENKMSVDASLPADMQCRFFSLSSAWFIITTLKLTRNRLMHVVYLQLYCLF